MEVEDFEPRMDADRGGGREVRKSKVVGRDVELRLKRFSAAAGEVLFDAVDEALGPDGFR